MPLPVHRVVFPMIEQPFSIDNVVFAMLGVCFRKIPRPSRSTASPFQATTDLSRSSASPFSDQCAFSSDQRELSVFLSGFPRAKVVFAARAVVFRAREVASRRSRVGFSTVGVRCAVARTIFSVKRTSFAPLELLCRFLVRPTALESESSTMFVSLLCRASTCVPGSGRRQRQSER